MKLPHKLIVLCSYLFSVLVNASSPVWLEDAFDKANMAQPDQVPRFVRVKDSIIKFIDIPISAENEKIKNDPPWLFIHGLGGSLHDFDKLVSLVKQANHAIAIDLPGFGESISFKDTYSIEKYVDILEEFMESTPYNQFHLVCHSMGGQICIALSLRKPQLVSSLTLIDPAGTYEQADFVEKIAKQLGKINLGKLSVNGATTFNSLTWYEQNIMKRILSPNPLLLMAIESYKTNLRQEVKNLTISPLVIWGLNDPIFSVANAFYLKENISGATLQIVENAEHNPQKTHPKLIYNWIKKYHKKSQKVD